MNNNICQHMKQLQKKAVKQIEKEPPARQCRSCTLSIHEHVVICLHCNHAYCSECIRDHQSEEANHIFTLNISCFLLNCKECKDDIESLVEDYEGQQSDPQFQRMVRFMEFIRDLWIKLAICYGVERPAPNITGLVNLGNTCFLNSTLQVLSACGPLAKLYSETKFTSQKIHKKLLPKDIQIFYDEIIEKHENETWHIVTSKKDRKQNKFFCPISTIKNNKFNGIFADFIREKSSAVDSIQPFQLLHKLCQFDNKYSYKQEQDAQELLILILDSLSQGEMLSVDADMERYNQIQKIIGRQKISMIQQIFGCYLASQIICQQCKKQSWTLDLTYHLSVPISHRKNPLEPSPPAQVKGIKYHRELYYPESKSECHPLISNFFQGQRLNKYINYYSCQHCNGVNGMKKFFLVDPPQILTISLKRFEKEKKIKDFIPFPQTLDVSMVCLTDREQSVREYRLFGMIVHDGSTVNSGHYLAYVRVEGSWYRCSDEEVKGVSWRQVKQKQGYILFYER